MSYERAHRVGLNEAIFRQVNEQIRSLDRDVVRKDEGARAELSRELDPRS